MENFQLSRTLFLKIEFFSCLIEAGTSSHIVGAKYERLPLLKWTVKFLFLLGIDEFLRSVNLNNEFTISEETCFYPYKLQFQGLLKSSSESKEIHVEA